MSFLKKPYANKLDNFYIMYKFLERHKLLNWFKKKENSEWYIRKMLNWEEQNSTKENLRTSLVVEWLRLRASNAEGMGSIPGQGTKIPHPQGVAKIK